MADRDLPGLVVEARKAEPPIDVALAAKDPAELGRALARPYRVMLAAIGPHGLSINSTTTVEEAGKTVSDLSDHAQIDNGDGGAYHAVYTNSSDYGRETTFIPAPGAAPGAGPGAAPGAGPGTSPGAGPSTSPGAGSGSAAGAGSAGIGGRLYLRPRYQRWHARAPELADEPAALRDQYADAIAATWDLLAPGAELTDRGPVQVAGRAGRKIEIRRAPEPARPAAEPLAQRKWREGRSVDAVSGEIVLDAEHGVPLAVTLTGIVGFSRDGRRFAMKLSVDSTISGIGSASAIATPAEGDMVATPERMREVDDRDYLLQGIAPPLRRNPDGTAIPPVPRALAGVSVAPGAGSASPSDTPGKPDAAKPAAKPARHSARSDGAPP
ncbi:MAG TPA: hypothetical protein VH165_11485 [Kofleriaceae bacterium]|nr:hypothetical protein [Kofleriaceae bacterium]